MQRVSPHPSSRSTAGRRATEMLVVLAALAIVCGCAQYLVGDHLQVWVANGSWVAGAAAALIGTWMAYGRAQGHERRGWRVLVAASAAWMAAEIAWIVLGATSVPLAGHVADGLFLAFPVMAAVAVHRLAGRGRQRRSLLWTEVTLLAVAACSLLSALLWNDIESSELALGAVIVSTAYAIVYVAAALVMLQTVVARSLDLRHNRGLVAVLAGLALEVLAFILWSPKLLAGTYVAGVNAIDVLWTLGLVLIGVGAAWSGPVVVDDIADDQARAGVLPQLMFVALVGTDLAFAVSGHHGGGEVPLTLGVASVGAALAVRTSLLRRELGRLNDRLAVESRSDALTGLGNRLRLTEDLADMSARLDRYGDGYCVILCDVDRFKDYNDEHGHLAGDEALRRVADLLLLGARSGDRVYRYGGEELLLLLPEQDERAAHAVAERHRLALENLALPHPTNPEGVVTLSAGIAAASAGDSAEDVLRRADTALYEAKASGRNRTARTVQPAALA